MPIYDEDERVKGHTVNVKVTRLDPTKKIPCPFVYSTGKNCEGHIESAWQRAKVVWNWEFRDGEWIRTESRTIDTTSHIHLICSLKNNHAGSQRPTPQVMKVWGLPELES